jgi:hypothetical protein
MRSTQSRLSGVAERVFDVKNDWIAGMANRAGRTLRKRGVGERSIRCTVRFTDDAYKIAEAMAQACGASRDEILDRIMRHVGSQLGPDGAFDASTQLDPSRIPGWLRDDDWRAGPLSGSQEALDLGISA